MPRLEIDIRQVDYDGDAGVMRGKVLSHSRKGPQMITATKPCKCSEARVESSTPRTASVSDRKWGHSDELSAVAAQAHDCEYVRWRNAKIRQAEENANGIARRELAGKQATSGQFGALVNRHFIDQMNILCGTPNYAEGR